ncbi:filamentous haemagglutinin family protein [Rhodoplanes azumiensis]|uniref:Filamentous hemagglutinin family protein n=1 Tax=Rhodoplanes azumiensis TaxID=1897628 RepID=A0ABW5ANP1_9BRAD
MTKSASHLRRGLAPLGPQPCDTPPCVRAARDLPGRERAPGRASARAAALLAGVSLLALVTAGGPGHALNLKSPGVVSPGAAAAAAQQAAAAQAAAAAQQAKESLAAAAAALQALRASQDAARSLALQAGATVPNGIATGGLMPQGGVTRDASSTAAETRWIVDGADPTLWQGASRTVTETTEGGRTTVGVTQTEKKAILNWETFNVGSATTLAFGQQAADWTVLNRVGPSVAPSQILGNITAKGGVYVINRNGIIFGGGAQINVHALVASTLDVGQLGTDRQTRDGYFLNTGIATGQAFSVFDPNGGVTTSLQADVLVQPGARITTDIVDLDSPGFVFLFGANVRNAGTITSPGGQVAMVAARQIEITPGVDAAADFPADVLPSDRSFKGVGFLIRNYSNSYRATDGSGDSWKAGDPVDKAFKAGTGGVVNDGLIETPRGIVTLVGDKLRLGSGGVISADTGISRNSMVLMHATTSIDVDGVISMLPYDDPDTPTLPLGGSGSTVQSFAPAYVELAAQSTVTMSGSGLISAPSASVTLTGLTFTNATSGAAGSRDLGIGTTQFNPSVTGPQRVLLAAGAVIDVAGLQDVEVPVSWNYVSFEPRSEFADMPLQRSSALYGQELWIDIRASGTRSDGTTWVGTPLADASGVVAGVGRSIYQLMTTGGKVSLTTETTAPSTTQTGREVIQQAGSVVNMAGGSVRYTAGMVNTTRLLGIDGRIYAMENASPDMIYVGIFGQFTRNHQRWGVSETWGLPTQRWEGGYVDGADAGGLTVATITPVLQSTMLFGSTPGERQIRTAALPSQGYLDLTTTSTVVIGANGAVLPADFATAYASTALPQTNPISAALAVSDNFRSTSKVQTLLSADTLSSWGLSALTITSNDLVVQKGSTVTLAAGGEFTVKTGGAIDIAGTVRAAGGAISLTTDSNAVKSAVDGQTLSVTASGHFDVFVGGTLDVSGRWVNDTGRFGGDSGAQGSAYTDGGTIAIQTNNWSAAGNDRTGSILLAQGSVLDVSSGGYVSPSGTAKMASSGLMSGKGGRISLALYGTQWDEERPPVRPVGGGIAQIQLDGTLRGFGFETNGTLEISAPLTVRIGGTLAAGEESAIRISSIDATKGVALPLSLFTDGGFGAYTIASTPDGYSGKPSGVTVSAGVELALRQVNLASDVDYGTVPTGTTIADVAPRAVQPLDRRAPVNLTLRGDTILIDADATHGAARIVTDPGAVVTLAGRADLVKFGRAVNVLILGEIENHGGTVAINAERTWFGATAKIDLSGVFVERSDFGLPGGPTMSGTVLAGGTLAIEAARTTDLQPTATSGATTETKLDLSGTYVVAEAGAVVDVSGATGTIVVPGTVSEPNAVFQAWSDAGTVRVNAGAFVWGGSFVADADPRANRGTLILGGSPTVNLRQTSTAVRAALAAVTSPVTASALTALTATPSLAAYNNTIEVAVADLGAFDNVYLYAGTSRGGAERIFTGLDGGTEIYNHRNPNLGSIYIRESIDWTVANRLAIAAQGIYATGATATSATLSASYVALTGGGPRWTTPGTGTGTFTVAAQTIDVEGAAVGGFGRVALVAANDIRLSTPKVVNGIDPTSKAETNAATFAGRLDLDGSLVMEAQRIYPVSAVDFTIQTPGTVTVRAPAGSDTTLPLSAGGSLTVLATDIVQGGNLFAPLGKITLGNTNPDVSPIVTRSVTLVDGSLTSVTLADTVVPYGATLDGTGWYYNASLAPLATPPSKGLVLDGGTVDESAGAVIDVRGGGDLLATEFVQGKNGSRDVLAQPGVYALVPTRSDTIAAFDIHFTTADNARTATDATASKPGDAYPLAGTQITIAGGGGIPAGTYTLYPAHYATLPGAYAVSVSGKVGGVTLGSASGTRIASGTTLPDGTVLVTGQYTQSTASGKTTSGTELFAIRSGSVWQQYSEYAFSGANAYFTSKAVHDGTVVPRLPVDAGRVAVVAQQQIVLDAIARTQPGPGGRGSELDLSAAKLAVVDHARMAANDPSLQALRAEGYVTFDVAQLDAIGFESVLFGGLRSDTAKGTRIDAKSIQVLVDSRGEALSAPEILLVAQQGPRTQQTVRYYLKADIDGTAPIDTMVEVPVYAPAAGSGTVTIASGSIIDVSGTINAGAGRYYYFDNPTVDPAAAAALATYLGGTLDGTTITGAQLTKLPLYVAGGVDANGATIWVPQTTQPGSPEYAALVAALNAVYKPSATGAPGALFAASADPGLRVAGPTSDALVVSFANQGDYTLRNTVALSDNGAGRVVIQPGATVRAPDATVTIQATTHTDAIGLGADTLVARQVDLRAPTVTIGATGPAAALRIVGDTFRRVEGLSVTALSGVITLGGDFTSDTLQRLTLDARTILGIGTSASILTPNAAVTLVNSGTAGASTLPAPTAGTFTIASSELVLGGGKQAILGFVAADWTASRQMRVAASGTLGLGFDPARLDATTGAPPSTAPAVALTVTTPSILVAGASATGTGSQFALITKGQARFTGRSGTDEPAPGAELGGSFAVTAAGIVLDTVLQAQSGTLALTATTGDVVLGDHAFVAAGGYAKTMVDQTVYVMGGKLTLTADTGRVVTRSGSVIDLAQPAGGLGYGGELIISSDGTPVLDGQLRGSGGPGLGGRFELTTKGALDTARFNALADALYAGGFDGLIDIHTRQGNLELLEGHTLKANAVALTADGGVEVPGDGNGDGTVTSGETKWIVDPTGATGRVVIAGTIDARGYDGLTVDGTGQAGGQVALWGGNAVVLTGTDGGRAGGKILASTEHADERGGDVAIGVAWDAKWDAATKIGGIDLQAGSVIDVHGGTKGGLSGGTVTLRAPRDGNDDVKVQRIESTVTGARAVGIEAYVAFSTSGEGGLGNVGWDGVVDPAGYYKVLPTGQIILENGTWTGVGGWTLSIGGTYTSAPVVAINGVNQTTVLKVASSTLSVSSGGSYSQLPIVTYVADGQVVAQGTAPGRVTAIAITGGPAVSTSAPVIFSGSTLVGTGIVQNGVLVGVNVTNTALTTLPSSLLVIGSGTITNGTGGVAFSGTYTVTSGAVTGITSLASFSGTPTIAIDPTYAVGGATATVNAAASTVGLGVAVKIASSTGYSAAPTAAAVSINGVTCPVATCTWTTASAGTGQLVDGVFVAENFVPRTGTYSTTSPTPIGTASYTPSTGTGNAHYTFYNDTLAKVVDGTWTYYGASFGFSNAVSRLLVPLAQKLGDGVVHLTPGVELINPVTWANQGNITVVSNWNLAAGTAYNPTTGTKLADGSKYVQVDDPSGAPPSYVDLLYRYVGDYGTGRKYVEPGALTLRALNDVKIKASISDGFFQFGNTLDASYRTSVATYLNNTTASNPTIDGGLYYIRGYSSAYTVPVAPYRAASNGTSPTTDALAAADLFPNQLRVCVSANCDPGAGAVEVATVTDPGSWSYRITAGADTASADPGAMRAPTGATRGDIVVDGHATTTLSYRQSGTTTGTTTVDLATMVRTGTGDITLRAARDVILADTVAPGVIYAAGVNTPKLPDPGYSSVGGAVVAADPDGFYEPVLVGYGAASDNGLKIAGGLYGPVTAAAFPHKGGDVDVEAQRDIVGYAGSTATARTGYQYYEPWLLSLAGTSSYQLVTINAVDVLLGTLGAGSYAPSATTSTPQTAWWIEYGSFRQGILSAGGDVTLTAGRDIKDVSVSLPTTGRVSGGLVSRASGTLSTPVVHLYDSGTMAVRAGRDLLGGAYYQGSGHGTVTARGSIGAYGSIKNLSTSSVTFPNVPVLAVDTGRLFVTAGGALTVASPVNPAALHQQAQVTAKGTSATYMDTYGPDSLVSLTAVSGDLTIRVAPTSIGTTAAADTTANPLAVPVSAAATYPASFAAVAVSGDIVTTGIVASSTLQFGTVGMMLSGSEHGSLRLLADGSIDLTFGYRNGTYNGFAVAGVVAPPYVSAGPALLDAAFDPFRPNAWYGTRPDDPTFAGEALSKPVLAHADDAAVARIYAVTGDIRAAGATTKVSNLDRTVTGLIRVELNQPAEIYAGRDIVDLNLIVQNTAASDVSSVIAGRDITYTGYNNAGGLQVAGPGTFLVQAGRDLGPFVAPAFNTPDRLLIQQGIASVGNASETPVGNVRIAGQPIGLYNAALVGAYEKGYNVGKSRNSLLGSTGADLVVLFGVAGGLDTTAMAATYIDPVDATTVAHTYAGEFEAFLARMNIARDPSRSLLDAFAALSPNLKTVFSAQILFAELKAVGESVKTGADYARGYTAVSTLFPARLGYTANDLTGGSNGANLQVSTGDLDLRHATIQTRFGGDISILGPGGDVIVGSLATEPNTNLKLRDLGLMTFAGGRIATFTDGSVLVNSSRVLTTQGGDVLMWSSNGDLDAGRGSKTTLSLPPLQVEYDSDAYQSVDLGGLVTGAGIGVLKTSRLARTSNTYLLAPRGIIDAGTAGIRASGNLTVAAVTIVNADNIKVGGATTGVPTVTAPNVGGLTAASNAAGAAAKPAETPTAGGRGDQASVFVVQVVGYGGGDADGGSTPTPVSPPAPPAAGPSASPTGSPDGSAAPAGRSSRPGNDTNDQGGR